MNQLSMERIKFIDLLNEEFLSNTGYGAYAYLSTFETVNLFEQFVKQSKPAQLFIKSFVKNFNG